MFQSYVFFPSNQYYSVIRKRHPLIIINSTELPEGKGVAATSLGNLKSCLGLIHLVPSDEGATATSLGIFVLIQKCKKINRKYFIKLT